jgi:hypothetical protein
MCCLFFCKGTHGFASAAIHALFRIDYSIEKSFPILFHGNGIGGTNAVTGGAAAALFFCWVEDTPVLSLQIPDGGAAMGKLFVNLVEYTQRQGR